MSDHKFCDDDINECITFGENKYGVRIKFYDDVDFTDLSKDDVVHLAEMLGLHTYPIPQPEEK